MSGYKKVGFGQDAGVTPGDITWESYPPYTLSFSNTDWTISGSYATISVPFSIHQKGYFPTAEVYEIVAFNLEKVNTEVVIDNTGLVTIKVSFIPDLRFSGRLIIS